MLSMKTEMVGTLQRHCSEICNLPSSMSGIQQYWQMSVIKLDKNWFLAHKNPRCVSQILFLFGNTKNNMLHKIKIGHQVSKSPVNKCKEMHVFKICTFQYTNQQNKFDFEFLKNTSNFSFKSKWRNAILFWSTRFITTIMRSYSTYLSTKFLQFF